MNRSLRTIVPRTQRQKQPKVSKLEEAKEREGLLKTRHHHGTRELPLLNSGQLVWLPESSVTVNVGEQVDPRPYLVNTPQGQVRRNRRDLIQIPNTLNTTIAATPSPSVRKNTRVTYSPKI